MTPEKFLTGLRKDIAPSKTLRSDVWNRVSARIDLPQTEAFSRIRISLLPSAELKEEIKRRVRQRLTPIHAAASRGFALKWTAAFALAVLMVRVSPMFFIASSTVAETAALLVPTRGEVSISIGGMWQNVEGEMALEPGMMLRTYDGEASIILHDDGVIRLAPNTSVTLHDISNRLEPASEVLPSITLYTGRIWLHGMVPPQLRGITVTTSFGHVTVNEGSISIAEDDYVDVEVYDRSATITKNGEKTYLASGERTQLADNSVLLVKKIPSKWYQYDWANQNLGRDAVHRHDIAQLQHERRIAQAGILPTSPFYSVKRFAEAMDVWLTFDRKSRVQKQLQGAETRLNEAAALIYNGDEAKEALDEYSATLEYLTSEGQKNGSIAEFLVQRALAESAAQISAALPGDESYVIKKTVLETSAKMPSGIVREGEARGTLLLDGLAVMVKAADEGKTEMVSTVWSDLHPYVLTLEDEDIVLDPVMHKEAKTLLTFLATSLHVASRRGAEIDPELLDDIAAYLPPPENTVVSLSEEEIMQIVLRIKENIFLYSMTQPRINQFTAELRALESHPDLGRILRRLAFALPEGPENFPDRVYKEIVRLRWEYAAEAI